MVAVLWSASAFGAEIPRCRLVIPAGPFEEMLERTGNAALLAMHRVDPRFLAGKVVVSKSDPEARLTISLVADARTTEVDAYTGCVGHSGKDDKRQAARDPISIRGVCNAGGTPDHPELRCSFGALQALVGRDVSSDMTSGTLLFLFAHELSHLSLGHGGDFAGAPIAIDRAASLQDKRVKLKDACGSWSRDQEAEQAADDRALVVIRGSVAEDGFWNPALGRRVGVLGAANAAESQAEHLADWERSWVVTAGERPMLLAALSDPMATTGTRYVTWAVERTICDVLEPGSGTLVLPSLYGDHPQDSRRLAKLIETLQKTARSVSDEAPSPALPMDMRQTMSLGAAIAAADASEYQNFFEAFAKQFCARAEAEWPSEVSACRRVSRLPSTQSRAKAAHRRVHR